MTHTGTIKLIYQEDIFAMKNYDCVFLRKEIIEEWKLIYGGRIYNCVIQIRPDIKEQK